MPILLTVDSNKGRVISKALGVLIDEELFEHRKQFDTHTQIDRSYDHLFDFSEVTEVHLSTRAIEKIANNSFFSATSRIALVAPSDVKFGLSRMYENFRGNSSTLRIFRNTDEAIAWLDSP